MQRSSSGWRRFPLIVVGLLLFAAILIRIQHKDGTESTLQFDSRSVESITIEPNGRPTKSARIERTPASVDRIDGALRFDGNRYVEIRLLRYDGGQPFTIEAWVTPDRLRKSIPFVNVLTVKGAATIRLGSDGRWMAVAPRDVETGDLDAAKSQTHAQFGMKVHVALVWDGSQVRLYIGGKRQAESIDNLRLTTSQSVRIGGYVSEDGTGRTHLFHGAIDEVRISEVARYQGDFTPKERFEPDPDTTALYHFDQRTGSTVRDDSDNEHEGAIFAVRSDDVDTSSQADEDK